MTRATTQPSIACGPPIAAISTGMVMNGPTRRIDYVFVSSSLSGGLVGAKVLDESQGAVYLSDHRGVAAAL